MKFKTQKMSKGADMKLRYKLYTMILKKYFKNIKNVLKLVFGTMVAIIIGVFTITNFGGSNMLAINPEVQIQNTSNIVLSKEYREKRVMAFHKASQLNRLNTLKTQKYKDISFKRKLVNN